MQDTRNFIDFDDIDENGPQSYHATFEIPAAELERDGQLLLSFDRSLDLYIKDAAERRQFPSARWAVRADSAKLVPILSQLSENLGLRIASPRIFRGARDADRWISALGRAASIEAYDATDGAAEQLSVDIATPK